MMASPLMRVNCIVMINTNVKKWDTSAVPDGTYYVYGIASSSGDTVIRYSEGRVRVDHSLTQDTTAPILNCERPYSDYEFDTSLELAGYALDETRLATLEAFIDGDRQAETRDIIKAAENITPTAHMMSEKIEEIRKWARNNIKGVGSRTENTGLAGNRTDRIYEL